ncbi:T/G mismatch-specific endonuclease [Humitalea rosea]|uniref:T/G mismatch-specific endonuclease n=2 Tax=Humitalea rosea TaxID=990373 RepID=A0A2W7HXC6_9PROT|nr:T/G mismatch-specific endonuclease [Humitalea rosea]
MASARLRGAIRRASRSRPDPRRGRPGPSLRVASLRSAGGTARTRRSSSQGRNGQGRSHSEARAGSALRPALPGSALPQPCRGRHRRLGSRSGDRPTGSRFGQCAHRRLCCCRGCRRRPSIVCIQAHAWLRPAHALTAGPFQTACRGLDSGRMIRRPTIIRKRKKGIILEAGEAEAERPAGQRRHRGDIMSVETRSRVMARIKGKGTGPELRLAALLSEVGLAWESHARDLPGRPDFVFRDRRVAVFVDGDFWHGWRFPVWRDKLSEAWEAKIEATRLRDSRNFRRLRRSGWRVVRVWEHQLARDPEGSVARVKKALASTP